MNQDDPKDSEAETPQERARKRIQERVDLQNLLFNNLKSALPELEALLKKVNEEWAGEDLVYRYYHHSFKVYGIQKLTEDIYHALQRLLPDRPFSWMFADILIKGTGKHFQQEHNSNWMAITGPMVEAFFHARYMLEMGVKYGKELESPPNMLPSGWAAFLYIFNLR